MQLLTAALGLIALCASSGARAATQSNGTVSEQFNLGEKVLFNGKVIPYGVLTETAIGPTTVSHLMLAMSLRENYGPQVGRPVCVAAVKKASVQVLQGINYLFQVDGCAQTFADTLGECQERGCLQTALWEVKLFVQPTNNTYRVESIEFLG